MKWMGVKDWHDYKCNENKKKAATSGKDCMIHDTVS